MRDKNLVSFPYISSHLYYILFEILKNAVKANYEFNKNKKEIPNINDPVIIKDDNGVPYYDTNEEFAGRRAEYISKLRASKGVRQNMITEYENNRELIGEEIFTDIQAKRIGPVYIHENLTPTDGKNDDSENQKNPPNQ